MEHFIFLFPTDDHDGIFRDLTLPDSRKIIDYLPTFYRNNHGIGKIISKVALNNKLTIIPDTIKASFFNLENYYYQVDRIYHMIIPSSSIAKLTISYLKNFKRNHPNVKLYALLTDSMHASSPHMSFVRDKLTSEVWDYVLTYDPYDAQEYKFVWFGYSYYSSFDYVEPDEMTSDLYYIGYNKGGREKTILELYDNLKKQNVNCRFDIVSKKPNRFNDLVYLANKISYPEVVSRVKSTNCILEILQDGQETQSLRYFESILYGKKLLTNNKHIMELPFYNPNYMRYIGPFDEIDYKWIQRKEDVQYEYHNEFSPLGLIDFIKTL